MVYYTSYFLLEASQTEIPRNDRSRPRSKPALLTYWQLRNTHNLSLVWAACNYSYNKQKYKTKSWTGNLALHAHTYQIEWDGFSAGMRPNLFIIIIFSLASSLRNCHINKSNVIKLNP